MQDLFELINSSNIDYKEFLSTHYGFVWRKNKTVCPFHGDDEKNPNLSYEPKKKILKCFVCEAGGGDLINFVRDYKKVDKMTACMEILDLEKIPYERGDRTRVETQEDIDKRKKEFDEAKVKREEERKAQEKKEKADKEKAIIKSTAIAESLSDEFKKSKYLELRKSMFPFARFSSKFSEYESLYVGYDAKQHDSICILNRIDDEQKTTFSIKTRDKYEWDKETKTFLEHRRDGKWLGNYDATTHIFPYDYFKRHKDEIVFVAEGEKDALNLLSYDINVVTLGGTGTSWSNYKEELKDKIIYIWFDNDNPGYKGAINRYNELKDVAKDIFIVLFFNINSALPKGYDISDFIKEKDFKNKDEIFHSIAYSSYKLTTAVILDIENYTGLDLKDEYFTNPSKTIYDIQQEWVKKGKDNSPINIIKAVGQKDLKGFNQFLEYFKDEKKYKNFYKITTEQIAINMVGIDEEKREEKSLELVELMKNLALNYEALHKDYAQTGIADMVTAFEMMAKKTGNTFAKQGDALCIWTGTHYKRLDVHDDINGFVLKGWMPHAIDKKKRTTRNVKEILEDVYTGAASLDKIKFYKQKGVRVVNLLNGTLFITKDGKVTFKNIHDKKDACTNMLEFEYDPNAKCPKWEKFLNRNFPNEADRNTLMEYMGYCFMPSHKFEKFLYMYGPEGANGKSVYLNTTKGFFGRENISAINLQDLKGHPLDGLVNKVLNIGSELDGKNLKDNQMGNLKALTSANDDLQIDPKFTRGFTLTSENQPKMLFSGNSELSPASLDGGVLRRVIPINCEITINDDEKVRELEERFLKDEMSGILNMALSSLENLVKRGKFTESTKSKEMIENYKDQANPIRRYISDCLEYDEDVIVPKDLLYSHYKEYMKEKGSMPLSQPKFFSKVFADMKKVRDIGQQRVEVKCMERDRPRFIQGIFCNKNDILSFDYGKAEVLTKDINYCAKNKKIIEREEKKEVNSTGEIK